MGYYIQGTDSKGCVQFIDSNSKISDEPFFWKSRESAENVLKTLKRNGNSFKYYKCVDEKLHPYSSDNNASTNLSNIDAEQILSAMQTIATCSSSLEELIESASKEVAVEDRKVSDMLHVLELECCDASKMAHVAKLIKESRRRRRKYKDLVLLLKSMRDMVTEEFALKTNQVSNALCCRNYKPREMPELFSK